MTDPAAIPEHPQEIAAAYSSSSGYGSASAYGDEIASMLAQEATLTTMKPPGLGGGPKGEPGAIEPDD